MQQVKQQQGCHNADPQLDLSVTFTFAVHACCRMRHERLVAAVQCCIVSLHWQPVQYKNLENHFLGFHHLICYPSCWHVQSRYCRHWRCCARSVSNLCAAQQLPAHHHKMHHYYCAAALQAGAISTLNSAAAACLCLLCSMWTRMRRSSDLQWPAGAKGSSSMARRSPGQARSSHAAADSQRLIRTMH